MFLCTMALLAACGEKNQENKAASAVRDELIYATAKDIHDMNPHLYTGSMPAQGMVYESLVENTKEGIKPLLAESWDLPKTAGLIPFI